MASPLFAGDQHDFAPTTLTDLYTCPMKMRAEVDVFIANRDAPALTFRISIAKAGAVDDPSQYLYYDADLLGNGTVRIKKLPLNEGDIVRGFISAAPASMGVYVRKLERLVET